MLSLSLPSFNYDLKLINGKVNIYDIIRKKYVFLSDEEWVRQHFINYLINNLNYPKALIKLECSVKYFKLKKRADIVVYERIGGKIFMLIECKSYKINIQHQHIIQAFSYNYKSAKFIVVTNGITNICFKAYDIDNSKRHTLNTEKVNYTIVDHIPPYSHFHIID